MSNVIEVVIKATDAFTAEFKKASQAGQQLEKDLGGSFLKVAAVMTAASAGIGLALRKTINDAVNWGGSIAEMSMKTGMAAETLSGLAYAANRLGFDLEGLQLGFKQAASAAYDASQGSEVAKSKFKTLGVEVNDLTTGKLKSMDQLLPEISDGLAAIENPTKKAALAADIFGRAGLALLPVLGQGSAEFQKFRDRARELGVELSGPQAEALHEYEIAVKDWHMSLLGIKIALTEALLPTLRPLIDYLIKVGGGIREWAREHPALTKAIGESALAIMAGTGLLAALTALVAIAPAVGTAVMLMTGPFGQLAFVIAGVATLIKDQMPGMAEDFETAALAASQLGTAMENQKRYWAKPADTGLSEFLGTIDAKLLAIWASGLKAVDVLRAVDQFGKPIPKGEPVPFSGAGTQPAGGPTAPGIELGKSSSELFLEQWAGIMATWGGMVESAFATVGSSLFAAVSQWLVYGKKFTTSFADAFRSMTSAIISMIGQIIAKWAALNIISTIAGGGGIGLVASLFMARGGMVPAYQFGGMVHGPAGLDRVPIMATAGEFIIPKPLVDLIRRGTGQQTTGGGSTVNNTYNISGNLDAYSFREWIRNGDGGRVLRAAGLI